MKYQKALGDPATKSGGFNRFTTLFLPKTALMRKLVDENTKKDDLKNKFEQNIKYKNVDKFVDELVGLITVHYS